MDLTKKQKRELRALAGVAYRRELERELERVEGDFSEWRAGRIDAFELQQRIHTFHNGPARKLYSFYESGGVELMVASAVARGIVREEEMPSDVAHLLAQGIAVLKAHDQ